MLNFLMKNILFILLICCIESSLSGQNLDELKKLQTEYKNALERQSLQKSSDITDAEKTASSTALPDKLIYSRKDIESLLANTKNLLEELDYLEDSLYTLPYIGYDIFTQRDTVPFWQNLPIPKYYNLGPGDEVIISLWGETESYDSKTIDRDGQVYINNIGILNLGGKTIIEANKYIKSKYSKVYSTLLSSPPKSFIDVTLGELKSVNVHFVGFVNIPGVHMIHPFSNVISGLSQAGGVDNKGSLRNIEIIRNGEVFRTLDLYNYLFLGKFVNDARLIDQDIIFVPSRSSRIPITGQVKKPGYYEIIKNETLSHLLNFTGGFESNSANTLFAFKNGTDKQNAFLLDLSQLENFSLSDGDSIHVPIKPPINKFININGQIKNAGKYPFQKGLSLKRVISATMSTEDEDFMRTIDFQKIRITRRNPSSINPLNIIVNLEKDNFILMNGDNINLPKIDSFTNIETVHITGEIKVPGLYPVNNLSRLSDILNMAGGVTNFALKNGVEVFRDSIRIGWENDSFFLASGDSLNILKKTGLVLVSGEVNVPGYITFKKGDSIKKYIKRAGGYSAFAENRDVLIIYPNGTAIPKTKFNSPKVFEGSEIIVNQRTISTYSTKSSGLQTFISITTGLGNITTTLVTISLLLNQSRLN